MRGRRNAETAPAPLSHIHLLKRVRLPKRVHSGQEIIHLCLVAVCYRLILLKSGCQLLTRDLFRDVLRQHFSLLDQSCQMRIVNGADVL
jgi:hypothetical protein